MFRKNLIIVGSFLALTFSGVAYAGSCPGSNGCPIDAETLAYLKSSGVPHSEIDMANKYLETYEATMFEISLSQLFNKE